MQRALSPALTEACETYRRAFAAREEMVQRLKRDKERDIPKDLVETYWRLDAAARQAAVTAHDLFTREHLDVAP